MNTTPTEINVALADDHPIAVAAVREAFSAVEGFHVVLTAPSGNALVNGLLKTPCKLVVTDLSMPQDGDDEDGLLLIKRLRRLFPDLPIVVFTMLTNGGILHQLVQMNVGGIVGKDEQLATLVQICQRALTERDTVLSPRVAARLAQGGHTEDDFRRIRTLSARELEVVRLFASGLSVTEISRHLNRSVTTVATQKRSAMRKLHLETNADLIRYATDHGFS